MRLLNDAVWKTTNDNVTNETNQTCTKLLLNWYMMSSSGTQKIGKNNWKDSISQIAGKRFVAGTLWRYKIVRSGQF